MQTSYLALRFRALPLLGLPLLGLTLSLTLVAAPAAQTPPPPSGQSPALVKAAATEPEPPKSIFRIPVTPKDGRNPFFPLSTLHQHMVTAPTNTPAAIVELELKGISGSVGRRLAIINNRTFEPGEEGTVLSNVGRVRITCKEITADSVRVAINGQERTLTLRPR